MKYLKLYEEFVSSDTQVNYKKGEFEVKEMFRIFSKLQDKLPKEIDRSIFDMSIENFGEPIEFERHIDPKFEGDQYTTDELLNLKEFTIEDEKGNKVKVSSEKYKPFINWVKQLFDKGSLTQTTRKDVEKIAQDSNSIGRGDFSEFLKDAELIKKLQSSYDKATGELSKHGLNIYQTGLFDKFPELKDDIRRAGQYDYYQNTWNILDKQIKEGEVSASSVLEIDSKMYLVGGNRRMAFYIGSGINPKIWLIKL
jgi:hypothetical protein